MHFNIFKIGKFLFVLLILIKSNSLFAEDKPETLKAYFESFARGEKKTTTDHWISPDKGYHLVGSLISTTLIGQLSLNGFETTTEKSQVIGAGMTFSLGIVKEKKCYNEEKGYNSRLDEMQAAFLRVKLGKLDEWNERRKKIASIYMDRLRDVGGVILPFVPEWADPSWHLL